MFSGAAEENQAAIKDQDSLSSQSPALSAGPDDREGGQPERGKGDDRGSTWWEEVAPMVQGPL